MRRRQLDEKEARRRNSTIARRDTQRLGATRGRPVLAEFAIRSETEGVVKESDEQTERRAKGVDEGEEKGGGK